MPADATSVQESLPPERDRHENYRLTHLFLLNETAVTLMLNKPQKRDLFAVSGGWLKALHIDTIE
jgi:hypothetical protein